MTAMRLSRRAVLRGAAAGGAVHVGLPVLEAMLDGRGLLPSARRAQAATGRPVRLVTIMFKNGVQLDRWTPPTAGPLTTLPSSLAPMDPFKADLNVITGLYNHPGVGGGHISNTGCFATGVPNGYEGAGGPSVDQVAAQKLGGATRLRSLVLAPDRVPGAEEGDGASDSNNHLSWAGKNQPVPPLIDPARVFDQIFGPGAGAAPGEAAAPNRTRKTVLDSVIKDIQRLTPALGSSDRQRLDAHLTAIRELQARLSFGSPVAAALSCTKGSRPAPDGKAAAFYASVAPEAKVKLMMDLLAMALKCDVTRFGSFNHCVDVGPHLKAKLGVTRGHHEISHEGPASAPIKEEYSRYQVEVFSHLVRRLKETDEGGSTLLDNSILYFANQIADGQTHFGFNLPVLLVGKGGGQIKTGRHLHLLPGEIRPGTPRKIGGRSVNDLFVSLLRYAGVQDVTTFGAGVGSPLDLST